LPIVLNAGILVVYLGFANSQTRNPTLVSLLEIEGIAENRHPGIPAIREEAKQVLGISL